MNNAQFRKLLETPRAERTPSLNGTTAATPLLGSRQRSSMPMTPRSVATSTDFARQLAAHNATLNPKPTKKFRSSAAPLGTSLAAGYVDRAKARDAAPDDERDARLEALAELAKEGKIDREEYVKQTKLLGGDVGSTHLVKGLDFKLLEKVRRGEDVMGNAEKMEEEEEGEGEGDEDAEEKLDKALEAEVVVVERKEEKKKEVQAAPVPKTRAEILAALKESRRAAKEAAQPSLGAKFKKIGEPKTKDKPKEEQKEKVKFITLPDGRIKKLVKREKPKKELEQPDPASAPLGMLPPPLPKSAQVEEEDDDDIFAGVGTDYNPLAGLQDDDDDDSSDEEGEAPESKKLKPEPEVEAEKTTTSTTPPAGESSISMAPPPPPRPKTNYFNEPSTTSSSKTTYTPPTATSLLSDPTLLAALSKASTLKSLSSSSTTSAEEAEKAKRHQILLESAERDAFDVDFGFGGSRDFGDEDEDDGYQVKKKGGGAKRKRGGEGKKGKKGDKNDAGVVGKIVEERYGGGKK